MLFGKAVRGVVRVFMYISIVATLIMLVVTMADVILRLLFSSPITGVIEMCQVLLVSVMATMAAVVLEKRNIEVDQIVKAFPKKVALITEICTLVLSIGYFAIVGWQTIMSVQFSYQFKVVYSMLRLAEWPFMGLLGVSFVVAAFASILYLANRIMEGIKPAEGAAKIEEDAISAELTELSLHYEEENLS